MQRDDNAAFNLFRLNLWARHFLHPHQHPDGRAPLVPQLTSPYAPPVPAPTPATSGLTEAHLGRPVFPGLVANSLTANSTSSTNSAALDELTSRRASLQFLNGHAAIPEVHPATSGHRISASSPEAATSPESEEASDTEPCAVGTVRCPVCKVVVQFDDVPDHLEYEMNQLRQSIDSNNTHTQIREHFETHNNKGGRMNSHSRFDNFIRIKRNREHRLGRLRCRKRSFHESLEDEQIDVISCDDNDDVTRLRNSIANGIHQDNNNCSQRISPNSDGLAEDLSTRKSDNNCNICKKTFTNPLTSMRCWHVFCELCWASCLRESSSCPACKVPLNATDLRRILV